MAGKQYGTPNDSSVYDMATPRKSSGAYDLAMPHAHRNNTYERADPRASGDSGRVNPKTYDFAEARASTDSGRKPSKGSVKIYTTYDLAAVDKSNSSNGSGFNKLAHTCVHLHIL